MSVAYTCLLCREKVGEAQFLGHTRTFHDTAEHLAIGWSHGRSIRPPRWIESLLVVDSPALAQVLGVERVTLRFEGSAPAGSSFDYASAEATAIHSDPTCFQIVDGGSAALSLATTVTRFGHRAVVLASSGDPFLPLLAATPGVLLLETTGAVEEETIRAFGRPLEGLVPAHSGVAWLVDGPRYAAVDNLNRGLTPDHILVSAERGVYLAGLGKGYLDMGSPAPQLWACGLEGAFPLARAYELGAVQLMLDHLGVDRRRLQGLADAPRRESRGLAPALAALRGCRGSVLRVSGVDALVRALSLLSESDDLLYQGVVPGLDGVLPLAAALERPQTFAPGDHVMIVLSSHAYASLPSLLPRLPSGLAERIEAAAHQSRPPWLTQDVALDQGQRVRLSRFARHADVVREVQAWMASS